MKKIILITVILIILCLVAGYQNNSNLNMIIFKLANKNNIKSGDLIYRVSFLGVLPLGEAIFNKEEVEEYENKKVYHLKASASALSIFHKFFSANAELDSYVGIEDGNPLLFRQKIRISGKPEVNKQISYDQKNGIMAISGVERAILPGTQDFLSAIFNLRRMDLNAAEKFEMNINTNQKNYMLKGELAPKTALVNNKTYRIYSLKANISRRDKNPYHKSKISIELLEINKEHIPVLIRVFTAGIFINAKLVKIR